MFQKRLFLLLLINFFRHTIQSYRLIDCSTSATYTTTLDADTLAFLETPNFPKTINSECSIELTTTADNNIWIAMLNGAADISFIDGSDGSQIDDYVKYDSNNDILISVSTTNEFTFAADSADSWSAIQAAVVSFESSFINITCPLSGKTFDFALNPDIVIPIRHTFYDDDVDDDDMDLTFNKKCNWNFTSDPETQWLKIVVKSFFSQDEDFSLSLTVDGNIVEDFYTNSVLYLNGSFANLIFSNQKSAGHFFLLISAVQKFENFTNEGCSKNGDTILGNLDYHKGYPPYQHCEDTIIVQENFESTLTLIESNYEECCDKLSFVFEGSFSFDSTLTLTSEANESQVVFTSDGNTQRAGYRATIETYKCECETPNIFPDCDHNDPVTIYPMKNTNYFCSGIICDFKILPNNNCPNNYFYLVFDPTSASINLTINGNSHIIGFNSGFEAYYSHKSNITFTFSSPSSPSVIRGIRSYSASLKHFEPDFAKIYLNETYTKHLLWLGDMRYNDAFTVCAASGTLEVYVSQTYYPSEDHPLDEYNLFDGDENGATLLGTLEDVQEKLRIQKSSSGCFTILSLNFEFLGNYMVLFKIAENNTLTNCGIDSTVYQISLKSIFDFQSSSAGSCKIDFFAEIDSDEFEVLPDVLINNITINSNASVSFLSIFENRLLFQLNASEASEWQYLDIYTPGLTLIIPPSSKITIFFEDYFSSNTTGIIQKGIITSPSYNGFNRNFNTTSLYGNYISDVFHQVTFSFKERYGNPKVVIQADDQNITLVNDTTTIRLYGFSLIYEETNFTTNGFLIEYIIDKTSFFSTVSTELFSTTSQQFLPSEIIPTTSISHSNKIEFAFFAVHAFNIIVFKFHLF